MSTIEKILLSLQENCNGKKDKLTNSYQERSVWLRNEFDVIRNLIKQNPRENMANQKESEPAPVEPTASSSSSVAREQSGDGRKRKSPETVNAVKLSPQQKRSSIDVDDLVVQAGLPSDLNKLKKEQLLVELEKRGNMHFSMKNVKNVLIDALRDTLLSEHQSREEAPEQPILQNASSVVQKESGDITDSVSSQASSASSVTAEGESTNMVLSTPSKPASVRKGSLMADFRSLVQNNNAQAGSTASNGASEGASTSSKRIEDEYQARMNRQRESIAARKSVLGEAHVALTAAAATTATAAVTPAAPMPEPPVLSAELPPAPPVKEASPTIAAAAPVLSLAVPVPVKATGVKDSIGSTASAASGDNIWMEVSSPVRTSSAAPAAEVENKREETESDSIVPAEESAHTAAAPAVSESHTRPRTESDASFQSCASTGSNMSKASAASASSKSTTTSASSTASSTHSSVRPISSKMSSYNTEKSAVAKSVAPTLVKAKLDLKPIDAPKAAFNSAAPLKKKDPIPENKPISKPVGAPSTTASAATAAPSAQPVRTVSATSAPVAPAPVAAAPVKRGLFDFLSKKNATPAPATTTVSSAAPAPANSTVAAASALSSSGGGLFSPSAQSSNRSAAPAMVDSIIKSGKIDAAPAASAPTPAPASVQRASPSEQSADSSKGPLHGSGGKMAGTPGAPLNNAFANKSLISNIVNNYNNAVKTTTTTTTASTPVTVKPVAAPVASSNSVLRDITPAAGTAPASAVKAAPVAAAVPSTPSTAAAPVNEYIIEDRDDSDEESGTDGEKEGEEGEDSKKPKQNVPDWARGPLLKEALERQYGMGGQVPVDPDLIFPEVTTCSLEEIFGAREGLSRKYANRSSSAHWDADQMTLVEKRVYRKHMGYDRGQAQTAAAGPLGAK